MKLHTWKDIEERSFTPEQRAEMERTVQQEILEMNLRALREMAGKTQVEVAELTQTTQAELSRTERRQDHLLSTLRTYVEALGGQLEVRAVFNDKTVRLKGI